MKNFITRFLALAFWSTLCGGIQANAQAEGPAPQGPAIHGATPEFREHSPELAANAPERYLVRKGDTLWEIAERFLAEPWRWPEIWHLNREQIENPNLIYPGDLIVLERPAGGQPRLRLSRLVASGRSDGGIGSDGDTAGGDKALLVERRSPRVRIEPLDREPVPTISSTAIEAFLNRPLIVDEQGLDKHPRIVATQDGRVYLSRGDLAYARGIDDAGVADWHIYRQAKPLLDPDTRQTLAWEALFVGTARLERLGDPATLRITAINEEIGVGDRLVPAEPPRVTQYLPRPPATVVQARIVAVYRGLSQVGRNSVVALNAGAAAGLEAGNVLEIRQKGRTVVDRETRASIDLPDESVGHLLVFRVFDKISYGLVMEASRSISVGDSLANP